MDMQGESGETIGPYRVLREIDADASAGSAAASVPAPQRGRMLEAVDSATGQRVALRLRRDARAPACRESQDCLRARLLAVARLRHPNLVAVQDGGWANDAAFEATEWIEGAEPLRDYLARTGPLPLFQRLALVVQMLSALAFAHDSRLAHGALTWDDLLVSRTGQLKVGGFGWADSADPSRDLRSAAAIAGQLLQGVPQYPGGESAGITVGQGGCPPALAQVLDGVMSAPPGAALPTAAQLSEQLQAACGRPAWSGEHAPAEAVADAPAEVSAAVRAQGAPVREPAGSVQPTAAPPTPVAVLSSAGAQRIELALAACCLAMVAWAANLLVGGSPDSASMPAQAELRATVELPAPAPARLQPAVPAAAASLVPLAPAAALPAVADVPAPSEPPQSANGPRHVQDAVGLPSADPSTNVPPSAHPPAGADRRIRPPAPVAQASPAPLARHVRDTMPSKPAARIVGRTSGPEWRCQHGLALTRDLCVALYCQASEYRRTPSCMRLHAQGRRGTGVDAQGGT